MITCDTSVVVAAFARWHEEHGRAAAALQTVDAVVDHVAIESFSVLTRLPPPRRVAAETVIEFFDRYLPATTPRLPNPSSTEVLTLALRGDITGGAIYDLVVALAAAQADATLLSLDRRAVPAYRAAGVKHDLLS